jgi:hypothetical protein
MSDPMEDHRLRALVNQADEASRTRKDSTVLAAIHLELGRVFHDWVVRSAAEARNQAGQAPAAPPREREEAMLPNMATDEETPVEELVYTRETQPSEDDGWYTDEVEVTGRPLFDANEINRDEDTDIPHAGDPEGRGVSLDDAEEWSRDQATALGRGDPLGTSRELLAIQGDISSSDELAVEASRVQFATHELESQVGRLPRDVQIAVLGMLSARAHHLQDRLEVGVGPKLALDRLRRWQTARGLPVVAGLEPNGFPERGTWETDALAWWDLLDKPPQTSP